MNYGVLLDQKKNRKWVWIALDIRTRQVIALHIGGRKKTDAEMLWEVIPEEFKEQGDFYTDQHDAYQGAFPQDRLHQYKKKAVLQTSLKE